MAGLQSFEHVFLRITLYHILFIPSLIPYNILAGTIVALRDDTLERSICIGMVLDHYGHVAYFRIHRRPLRNSPAFEDTADFQPKIIMQLRCMMFLNDKRKFFAS